MCATGYIHQMKFRRDRIHILRGSIQVLKYTITIEIMRNIAVRRIPYTEKKLVSMLLYIPIFPEVGR